LVSTPSASTNTATVTLRATIQDITAVTGDPAYDPNAGDIRNAKVTFVNRDIPDPNPTGFQLIASNLAVSLVDPLDTKTGTVTYDWTANIGNQSSQAFTIGIIVTNYYSRNDSSDDTVIEVYKPGTGFITGGGYLVMSNSAGSYPGGLGTRNNFGFNVKYNKSSTNLQGHINAIVRNGGRVYQIKGNVMSALTADPLPGTGKAKFNGKANLQDITNPLNPISLDGNATLEVVMTDRGEPGSSDTIGITVWDKNGLLWFSSNWSTSTGKTLEQVLNGGNLVVH
jgi:hypothetical protein